MLTHSDYLHWLRVNAMTFEDERGIYGVPEWRQTQFALWGT